MDASRERTEPDGQKAARQAAAILALTGLIAIVAVPDLHEPLRLMAVPLAALLLAGAVVALPWQRWSGSRTVWLGLPSLAVLGAATWIFDGFAAGTGPFFILVFVWLGLHHGALAVLGYAVPAALSYAGGLWAAEAPAHLLGSTFVLIPAATAVGLVIGRHVGELDEAHDILTAEARWRTALMSTLAHDVRTPLTSISGAIEIVTDDQHTPARLQPLLESAMRQTRRITRLATGLLELERVEQGKLRLERRQLNFVAFAHEIAAITNPLDVVVDADPLLDVWADPDRLEQILVNLTINALRHGRPPVVLGARDDGDRMTLIVRDHGNGVPDADVPHLFQKFSSADKSPGSVGLGLWIVHVLAQAHDGAVGYERADPGARFTVSLPKGPPADTPHQGRSIQTAGPLNG